MRSTTNRHAIWTALAVVLTLVVSRSTLRAQTASPSFDCSQASGTVEDLICDDEGLAALDRRMTEVFATALESWPADEVPTLKALQRGWITGRNDCWKEDDVRGCVESSYRTRIVELQIQSGQLEAPTPVVYLCAGHEGTPFFATFYGETDPPSAVLTFGDDQVIVFIAPSGSGARYTAANVEFWEHHGQATVDWFGIELTCASH